MRLTSRFACLPAFSKIGSMILLMLLAGWVDIAQAQTTAHFNGVFSTLANGFSFSPNGVAVDSHGNVFVADSGNNAVEEIVAVNGVVSSTSSVNVIGGSGTFSAPNAVAVDGNGTVYVADTGHQTVDEILPSGGGISSSSSVFPLVGNGTFAIPDGVAVDSHGNVFVADSGKNAVYEIMAGLSSATTIGSGFAAPAGVTVDSKGNVFVADSGNGAVKEIVANSSGVVSAASTVTTIGSGFHTPSGVSVDSHGNVFVADSYKNAVYEIVAVNGAVSSSSTVTTISSSFSSPFGVAVDSSGDIFVADSLNFVVDKIMIGGINFGAAPVATTTPPMLALTFTIDTAGTLNSTTPYTVLTQGATKDSQGNPLDFAAASTGNTCTGPVAAGTTCTVNVTFTPKRPGQRYGAVELLDSTGNVLAMAYVYGTGQGPQIVFNQASNPGAVTTVGNPSKFTDPYGVAVDASGNIFVADYYQNGTGAVLEMTAASSYATVKTLGQANFYNPTSVAVDGAGNVFVADQNNNGVKEIVAAGGYTTVNTLAQANGNFSTPDGVAVDGAGNVFVADASNNAVKEIMAAGGYTTVNTLAQTNGNFNSPEGVAVDGSGNLFVADSGNNLIKEIVAAGGYTTVNTLAEAYGPFGFPISVALDASGSVFVANDSGPHFVEKILAAGGYTTVIDLSTDFTSYLSGLPNAVIPAPVGIALDGNGNVFVTNFLNPTTVPVVKMDYADPPPVANLTFATPTNVGSPDNTDGPKTVTVQNIGNESLSFTTPPMGGSNPSYPANFPINPGSTGDTNPLCATSLAIAASCDVSAIFQPTDGGTNSGNIVLTTNALNVETSGVGSAMQNIALSGTGTGGVTIEILPASLSNGTYGVQYPITSFSASGGAVPYTFTSTAAPAGMTFSPGTNSATLSGAPTAAGDLHFTVTATDNNGATGTQAYTLHVSAAVPGAPGIGTATAGSGQATVSFTPPSDNGGSTLTGYTVTSNPGGFTGTGTSSPITVTGLSNGTTYTFTVTATNSAGTGNPSSPSNSVTPKGSQTITFANPGTQNFGTAPTLSATASSGQPVVFSSSTTGVCTITSGGTLTFVTAGTCTINADQAGTSVYAPAPTKSQMFTVAAVVPGPPVIIAVVTAGSGQATVSFGSPAFNGGEQITAYTVTSSPGGITATGSSSPITVTGLQAGTAYTFTVTAINGVGAGSPSAPSDSVTIPIPNLVVTTASDDAGTASNCTTQSSTTTGTDASCSLRDALLQAGSLGGGNITFDSTKFASATTITLANGVLNLPTKTSVQGATTGSGVSLTNLVTVDGNHLSGVFMLSTGMTASLTDLIIANGQTGYANSGSGIWNQGSLTVANSTLSGNSTTNTGGGIYNIGTLTLTNSTLSGNSAPGNLGGGIYNTGILTVANSTFSGNSAYSGASLYNTGPQTVTVTNSTFSGNLATSSAGGIASGGPMTMTNSIVSGNTAPANADISGTNPTGTGNLDGVSAINLASLGYYGGPTQTMPPLPGSSALGGGTYQTGEPTTDQRGYARPSSGAIDAGAVQVTGNGPTVTGLAPASGPIAGGTSITITGSGFTGATGVSFGGTAGTGLVIVSDTQITATAPAGSAGAVDVTVVNIAGISATSSADKYTYSAFSATAAFGAEVLTQNHSLGGPVSTVTTTGGSGSLTYVISPSLPTGLSFDPARGYITGSPSVTSPSTTYTVTVTDSTNATATASFFLQVNAAVTATQAISSTTLTYNLATASFVPVTGGGGTGTLTYSIFPSLPSPLSFSTSGTVTGTPGAASAATTYTVTVTDANGASASASFLLTVNKAMATVTLGGLSATYDGNAHAATATTSPTGLTVGFTYNGSATAPTNANSYTVVGTISDDNYQGTATGTLTIAKATATVTLGSLAATYDGNAHAATATTSPTGLTVGFTYNGSATAPTNANSYTVVGTINDTNYQGTATGTLTIAKATATVTLGGLAATYDGSAHAATATTSPTGLTVGFTYNGSATAPTNANSYTVVGTINDTNYQGTATGMLVIGKATPTIITPPTASAITYGQMLSDSTLGSGTVSLNSLPVPGMFAWTPSSTKPSAGTANYPVTFTPTDTTNFTTATGTASVTVSKATPTIATLPTASSITYGQTLTSSTLSGGVGSVGGTSVPGIFTWMASSTKPTAAGTPSYSITFTPTDVTDYNTATGMVSVIVNTASQTVMFTQPTPIAYGSTNIITLSATGGASDNPVTYTVASGPGSISGKVLTITGAGTIVIDANQTGNTNYAAATQVQQSLVVNKASSTLTGPATQPVQVINAQAGAIPITVAGQYSGAGITKPGSTISYSVSDNGFASGTAAVTNGIATIPVPSTVAPGTYTVAVSYAGDTNYAAATSINVSLQVGKIQPTISWTQPSAITYGTSLANLLNATAASGANPVPGTFSYLNGATSITSATVLSAGSYTLTVNFTPTDATTYKTATGTVSLRVNQVTPTLNWSAPAAITYGAALGAGQLDATASVQGAFTYTPAAGAVLQAGNHTLSATFVPADSTDYNTPATPVTTNIEVGKATPTVTSWPTVSGLAYGAALSSLKLNGGVANANGATVSGTFTWSNPSTIPAIGTQSYPVTFTPSDTTDYNSVAGTVSVSTDQVPTTTGLQSSAGEVMLLSPVTFTATVATSSGSPTGTVSFVDGSSPVGSAPVVNGVASLTVSTLTAGSHTVSAMYSGDGTYAGSTSGTVGETIIDLSTTQTVTGGSGNGTTTITVLPGGAANVTLDFTTTLSVTKLPVPAVLTVTGLPDGATVGVNPAVWSQSTGTSWTLPAATTLVNPNVAIKLPSLTASNVPQQGTLPGWQKTASASVLLGLLFLPFSRRMRNSGKRLRGGVMLAVLLMAGLAATVGLTGCGASNGFLGQQEKTYNVTMTVTAGTVTKTSNLTLTVQ